jgi:hypothetical protein
MTPQQVGLLSAAVPSPFGDALGLLADAAGYAQDPKSLTPLNGLLSLAGLLPGVPSKRMAKIADWTRGKGNADFLLHIADEANADAILKEGLKPGAMDDYVYLWKGGLDAEADKIMREARMTRLGLDWDEAGAVKDSFFAVDKKALGGRIEVDPFTGEARVKGKIPPQALRLLSK